MKQTVKNALQYIVNTNGGATKDIFIEDHEPVGNMLWKELEDLQYVLEDKDGKLQITCSAAHAMTESESDA